MIKLGNKYVYEHIFVWKKNNGNIPKGFVIHHINGIRNDNRVENLACMSQSDHMRLHQKLKNNTA